MQNSTVSGVQTLPRHPRAPKYPVIFPHPTADQITANFGPSDYAKVYFAGGISLPVGFAIGRGARVPTMLVSGLLGTIGGYLYSYQRSSGRLMGYFANNREVAMYLKKPKDVEKKAPAPAADADTAAKPVPVAAAQKEE